MQRSRHPRVFLMGEDVGKYGGAYAVSKDCLRGDLGVESAYAIIHPPQVAIVGIGRIVERPWVVDGRVEARSVITVSVSADHRAVDGRDAGSFLTAFHRALQEPETL